MVEQKLQFEARLRQIRAKELQTKQRYKNGEPNAKHIVCGNSTHILTTLLTPSENRGDWRKVGGRQ